MTKPLHLRSGKIKIIIFRYNVIMRCKSCYNDINGKAFVVEDYIFHEPCLVSYIKELESKNKTITKYTPRISTQEDRDAG